MGRAKIYPRGIMKRVNVNINPDFEKETMEKVREVVKPYHLLPDETESEYIKRIQDMHAENCENVALGKNKNL